MKSLRISENSKHSGNAGFTLIEVMISVALVSAVMVLIWQGTRQSINSKRISEERQAIYHYARVSIDKITDDLSMAFLVDGSAHLGQNQGTAATKTIFKGEEEQLSFPSLSHLRLFNNAKESESAEIGYRLEKDEEDPNFYKLERRESKRIDENPDEGGIWITIAEKVKSFSLEYYDGKKFDWVASWNSESTEKNQLPRAVRVKLNLGHPNRAEEEFPFATTVFLQLYANPISF
ncbi:MAG: type II secretion system protein GspJ [Deltaproteobacteria bacterium]|nr:type II secretion system protein GspJ [Deltaproteobacteria bacterium]